MRNDTIFGKILSGDIPADVVFESDDVLAFRDVNPVAPKHILVIPKKHIVNISDASVDDTALLGKLLLTAEQVAKAEGFEDYRVVINNGAGAGQTVFHLHVHVIAGRPLTWPPG